MFHMFWVSGVHAFPESHRLEVMGASDGILYASLLNVAYPYRIDLRAGLPSTSIPFIVYVSVLIPPGSVVAEPPTRGTTAPLR